jgi:hypothetical protein
VPCPSSIPFGQNLKAGQTTTVNGIRMYYDCPRRSLDTTARSTESDTAWSR